MFWKKTIFFINFLWAASELSAPTVEVKKWMIKQHILYAMMAFSMMVFPAVSPLSGQDCHECNLRLTFLRIYLPPLEQTAVCPGH